jgi:hypothetical protein
MDPETSMHGMMQMAARGMVSSSAGAVRETTM